MCLSQVFCPILWLIFSFSWHGVGIFTPQKWRMWQQIGAFPQQADWYTFASTSVHLRINHLLDEMFALALTNTQSSGGRRSMHLSLRIEAEQGCCRNKKEGICISHEVGMASQGTVNISKWLAAVWIPMPSKAANLPHRALFNSLSVATLHALSRHMWLQAITFITSDWASNYKTFPSPQKVILDRPGLEKNKTKKKSGRKAFQAERTKWEDSESETTWIILGREGCGSWTNRHHRIMKYL